MTQATTARPSWLANFAGRERELEAQGPDWLRALRRDALRRFNELGFPTSRLEAWKNTSVAPIVGAELHPPDPARPLPAEDSLPGVARLDLGGPRLAFVDGRHAPGLSTTAPAEQGVRIESLRHALENMPDRLRPYLERRAAADCDAFTALNAAFAEDGAVVFVPGGVSVEAPIQLLYGAGGGPAATASHPRTLIVAEAGSRVQVVETYFGFDDGTYFTNAVTDTFVDDNAVVDHYRLQMESPAGYHVSTFASRQGRDSRYTSHNVNLGARLARHDVIGVLDGEGADCRLNGLYMPRGDQHVDNHTVLDHAKPHGDSREIYKGILDDRGRAVFNGRIIVREDAQKTDAKQSNPNLLLSGTALAHTRPQLEIYADDVKCTHGATVGAMDQDAIFYLQCRGIARDDARNLLIKAFAGEVLDLIEIEPLRSYLDEVVARRLLKARDTSRR